MSSCFMSDPNRPPGAGACDSIATENVNAV
jgi:hypothetical protein